MPFAITRQNFKYQIQSEYREHVTAKGLVMQGCPRELSNLSWIKLSRLALVRLQLTFSNLGRLTKNGGYFFFSSMLQNH